MLDKKPEQSPQPSETRSTKTRLTTTSTTNRFRQRTKDECFTRFTRLHEPDRAVKPRRIDLSPQDRKPLVGLRELLLHHHLVRFGAHTPTSKRSSNGGPLLHHTTRRPRILQRNITQGKAQRRGSRANGPWPEQKSPAEFSSLRREEGPLSVRLKWSFRN